MTSSLINETDIILVFLSNTYMKKAPLQGAFFNLPILLITQHFPPQSANHHKDDDIDDTHDKATFLLFIKCGVA